MLQDEYLRIAKTIDHPSKEQAEQIIGAVLGKVRVKLRAMIVDVWLRSPGVDDILRNFVRRKEGGVPETQDISLHESAKGLLVYAAETCRPVWLEELRPGLKSSKNRLDPFEIIEGRHLLNIYERTRAFVAIPIKYRERLHAIFSIESSEAGSIRGPQIDLIHSLIEPTAILTWKADVFQEIRRHTDEEIDTFRNTVIQQSELTNVYRAGFLARPFDAPFDAISNKLANAFKERGVRLAIYKPRRGGVLIIPDLLAQLGTAHFVVADITGLNANVLIELGAMIGTGKPILIIKDISEKDREVPFNIAGYQYFSYKIRGQEATLIDSTGESLSLAEVVQAFTEQLSREGAFKGAPDWRGDD